MQPTTDQLMAVIETQTAIARLGLDLDGVMDVVAKRALTLTESATYRDDATSVDDLVAHADRAMYRAKVARGGDRVR